MGIDENSLPAPYAFNTKTQPQYPISNRNFDGRSFLTSKLVQNGRNQ